MARMLVLLDVDADPTTEDPEEILTNMIDAYDIDRQHGFDAPAIAVVSADWSE